MTTTPAQYAEMLRRRPKLAPTYPVQEEGLTLGRVATPKSQKTALAMRPSNDEAKMNKTERDWVTNLRLRNPQGLWVQAWTLKLGDDCRYTPDVLVLEDGKLYAHEVKGWMRDDALVKLKVAARMFPFIRFMLVRWNKSSGWDVKEIKP